MSSLATATGCTAVALTLVLLAGIGRRGLARLCYTFPIYLAVVALGDSLAMAWPEQLYTWPVWVTRETTHALLKIAIAVELSVVCFEAFPGAADRARRAILGMLTFTFAALLLPTGAKDFPALALELQPRVANGIAFLFLAIWSLVVWYRIPVDRFHLAILRGFIPYLLIFTVSLRLPVSLGARFTTIAGYAGVAAYLAMLGYWAVAAWSHGREPAGDVAIPESVVNRLQPWRAR